MADQGSFPQIPTSVWWGVRGILARNPRTKFDETALAVQLDVQPAAARQYLAEMKRLGLLTDDGSASETALRWRVDDTYRAATNELMAAAYPQSLLDLAPADNAERSKVERWFIAQGLGQGTARNKAGTYMLMANGEPGAPAPKQPAREQSQSTKIRIAKQSSPQKAPSKRDKPPPALASGDPIPLNVNVQIHISADASSEQIETIFSSMRKYLHGDAA